MNATVDAALFADRLGRLPDPGPDTALLIQDLTTLSWLTGYQGSNALGLYHQGAFVLMTDARYLEAARQHCQYHHLVELRGPSMHFFADWIQGQDLKALQFDPQIRYAEYQHLCQRCPQLELRALQTPLDRLRARKDASEIEAIRHAVQISIDAFELIRPRIRPGVTELDLRAELEYQMMRAGAPSMAFPSIVASGPQHAASPHHMASQRRLEPGDALIIDWGARPWYCADMTRSFLLGPVDKQLLKIYETVLDAQIAAIECLKTGVKLADVDRAARSLIERAGYGAAFGHGTGHALGLEVHEWPSLSPRSAEAVAEPGMVLTVEPGIYMPGVGGVRIEDLILVSEDGIEVLTSRLPKGLLDAQIAL